MLPNDLGHTRVGFTASRKVGNAVVRNRARRLMREAMRRLYPRVSPGWDLVLVARSPVADASLSDVAEGLCQLLERGALWQDAVEGDG